MAKTEIDFLKDGSDYVCQLSQYSTNMGAKVNPLRSCRYLSFIKDAQ